jgi:hypothetical protein
MWLGSVHQISGFEGVRLGLNSHGNHRNEVNTKGSSSLAEGSWEIS